MALGAMIRDAREHHPGKTALIAGGRTWTYEELDQITRAMASSFVTLGLLTGDRIALHFPNGPELVFAYCACFLIGAVAVPLNNRLKGAELEYILNHCGARLYLGEPSLFAEVDSVRGGLRSVERFFLAGSHAVASDVEEFSRLTAPLAGNVDFAPVPEHAPAVILYTSGTTARPKGVTHTHATLQHTIRNYREYSRLNHEDVVCVILSMAHIFAFALLLLPTLSAGATLLTLPRFEPSAALREMEQHRVTHLGALPVMYSAMVHCPEAAGRDLSALRFCLAGGDAVPTELQRQFRASFGAEITEACGMTEVIPYAGNPPYSAKREGSIGLPTPGIRLRIADDDGRELPPGETGEILVQSDAAMVGYWEDPESTAATLRDGWLHTGDLGRVDADGYYWFVGRKKEIIVRGGSNISPLEVEEALYQHPAVKEAGVVGVPDAAWGEIVQAFVALKDGAATTEEELKRFLADKVAAYKVPDTISFLHELPKGLTGKIHRKTLREQAIQAAQGPS